MNLFRRLFACPLAVLAAFVTALPTRSQPADTMPPTVSAFEFEAANSSQGTYNIAFSEAVTGVSIDDFYPVSTGNTGATITGVSGSGSAYTVAFSYTGNTGELQLRIKPSGTGIADAAGNAFAGGGVTSTLIVQNTNRTGDATAPVATSFTAGAPAAGTVMFTVAFDEAVDGVTAGMFTLSGLSGASIASVVSSGTAGTSYLVTVNYSGTSGAIALALNTATYAGIRDFNGNAYAGGGTASATATLGAAGDTTAPTVASFESMTDSGPTVLIGFSEAVTGVDPTDFTTTIVSGSGTATVAQVTATSTPGLYSLRLNYTGNGTVRVGLKSSGTGIADASGNAFAGGGALQTQTYSFSGTAVAAPTITHISDDTGTPGDGITTDTTVTIHGTAGPNLTILVSQPGSSTAPAQVQSDAAGNWSYVRSDGGYPLGMDRWIAQARDSAGNLSAISAEFHFWIVFAPTLSEQTPHLAVGQTVDLDLTRFASNTGMVPYTLTAQNLPPGLSVNREFHLVGTPTAAGRYFPSLTVDNGAGSDKKNWTFIVHATYPTLAAGIADQTVTGTAGLGVSYTLAATDAWAFTALDPLPAGLALGADSGDIYGNPTTVGTYVVRVRASNPVGSSTANVTFAIGADPGPRLISLQRPAARTYRPGETLAIGVTFDRGPVQFTGTPRLALQIGAHTRYATARNINAPALGFYYTLTADDAEADGIGLGAGIDLNGGIIRVGNVEMTALNFADAGISPAMRDLSGIRVDNTPLPTTRPVIWALAVTGTAGSPQNFRFAVRADGQPTEFSATGLPAGMQISSSTGRIGSGGAQLGSFVAQLTAGNSAGSTTLPVKFTVAANPFSVNGSRLPDGNDIGTVAVPADGTYRAGDALNFVVDLMFSAVVIGAPQLELKIGGHTRYATHVGTFDSAVAFRYVVAADDADADGIELVRDIQFPGGGWLRGASAPGINLKTDWLAHPDTSRILILATPPVVPPVTPPVVVPPVVIPPAPVAQRQTIAFATPVSAFFVNQPFALGGVATSSLPVSYSVVSGNATVDGAMLTIRDTNPVVIRATQTGNAAWSAAAPVETTFVAVKAAQTINFPTMETRLTTDGAVALAATSSSGLPIGYTLVSGPATLNGTTLRLTGEPGTVVIRAAQAGDGAVNSAVEVTRSFAVNPAVRVSNLSSRLRVTPGDGSRAVIVGFVIDGTATTSILVRAVGPGLAQFGIADALAAPRLQLFNSAGAVVADNNGWGSSADVASTSTRVGAFALAAGSADSAVVANLPPDAYTAQVTAAGSGTVLIEVYDAATGTQLSTQQLVNISTRGFVDTGDGALIAGFVVSGSASKRVLVRGIGPGLTQFGVPSALADPVVKIYANGTSAPVAENDNWETARDISAAITAAGAFPLAAGSKDAAVVLDLPPGQYSAIITGAGGATGAGLVEVYELP